jgi:hypothetical protein
VTIVCIRLQYLIRIAQVLVGVSLALIGGSAVADKYSYRITLGKDQGVCAHMGQVLNSTFIDPWGFTVTQPPGPPFPSLPGGEGSKDAASHPGILFSRYPGSPEFDAVDWRQGQLALGAPMTSPTVPLIAAVFDIDNDGHDDLVVKANFMLSFYPAGRAPGGDDELLILPTGSIDLRKAVTRSELTATFRGTAPRRIGPDLLGLPARQIRPFKYNGTIFLAVYDQVGVLGESKRKESMWILKYKGGGAKAGRGNWTPLNIERVCHFQMKVSK